MIKAVSFLLLVTAAIGVARFLVPTQGISGVNNINPIDAYKDFAHLFVGGLFGACLALFLITKNQQHWLKFLFLLFLTLCAVELFAFFK